MKAKLITDNKSLLLGFRLGGITGELVENEEDLGQTFNRLSKDKDLALIILSRSSYDPIKDEIEDFKLNNTRPLIVVLD